MKHRTGTTLLETAICVPIAFAILIGAIGLVQRAMVVTNIAKNQSLARRTIGNLSLQFRIDVRRSKSARLEKTTKFDQLILESEDQNSVIYKLEDSIIRRIESNGRQEQYLLSDERVAEFVILNVAERSSKLAAKRIRLTIKRSSKSEPDRSIADAEIDATLDAYSLVRSGATRNE